MATDITRKQLHDSIVSTGTSGVVDAQTFQELAADFGGQIVRPGDDGYDEARRVWNAAIDKHPALIARCTGLADVVAAVRFARKLGLLVAVRGGGHNVAGNATCDGGIVIDLSPMKGIAIDQEQQIAYAEPGLTWGEFDAATQAHGLALTGGIQSTTGIAGFTLGGGFGYLARKHGLTCDNLLSAQVVTADGQVLTASKDENADLLWGLRGGGGNFGIVTRFDLQLHPLGEVFGGMLIYPIERAREVIRFYRDFAKVEPDELFTILALLTAPPLPAVPQELKSKLVLAIFVCYSGDPHEGARVLEPLRTFGPPAADLLKVTAYREVQTMTDAANPPGRLNYWKSEFFTDYTDEVIDTILDYAGRRGSLFSKVLLAHMGGAIARVPHDETAYVHRDAPFIININAAWTDPAESEAYIRWARDYWSAMLRYSAGGVYVNFLNDEGQDRVKAAYDRPTYERLVALKQKYDPDNFFHLNQNITPS
jgi:FAD/FMN-containing dehydrogenase